MPRELTSLLDTTLTVDARPLAVTRVLVGAGALLVTLEKRGVLDALAAGAVPVPVIPLAVSTVGWMVDVWTVAALLAAVLLLLGLFARAAAAATSVLFALVVLWDQQLYSNHLTLLVLLAAYLAAGRPGGAWSLDSRRLGRQATPWWPQLLMMTQVSAVYLFAGLSKVNERYLGGDVLAEELVLPSLPAATFPVLAVASVVTEVGLAFALWHRQTRVVAALVGFALHSSIVASLGDPWVLAAFGLLTMSAYPLFLTRPSITARNPAVTPASR